MIYRMIQIRTPAIIRVSDYHEFDSIREVINSLKPSDRVKIKEVGFDGQYVGVLYTGNLANHKEFIVSAKKECAN